MPQVDINYWAVLVAAASAMVIGSIWYAKPVFGRQWMMMLGFNDDSMKQGAGKAMGIMTGMAVVTAYVLAHFVDYTGATDVMTGLQTGFWIWLGFILTAFLGNAMFEKRKMGVVWIFLGNQLVTLLAMGVILAVWQ